MDTYVYVHRNLINYLLTLRLNLRSLAVREKAPYRYTHTQENLYVSVPAYVVRLCSKLYWLWQTPIKPCRRSQNKSCFVFVPSVVLLESLIWKICNSFACLRFVCVFLTLLFCLVLCLTIDQYKRKAAIQKIKRQEASSVLSSLSSPPFLSLSTFPNIYVWLLGG